MHHLHSIDWDCCPPLQVTLDVKVTAGGLSQVTSNSSAGSSSRRRLQATAGACKHLLLAAFSAGQRAAAQLEDSGLVREWDAPRQGPMWQQLLNVGSDNQLWAATSNPHLALPAAEAVGSPPRLLRFSRRSAGSPDSLPLPAPRSLLQSGVSSAGLVFPGPLDVRASTARRLLQSGASSADFSYLSPLDLKLAFITLAFQSVSLCNSTSIESALNSTSSSISTQLQGCGMSAEAVLLNSQLAAANGNGHVPPLQVLSLSASTSR